MEEKNTYCMWRWQASVKVHNVWFFSFVTIVIFPFHLIIIIFIFYLNKTHSKWSTNRYKWGAGGETVTSLTIKIEMLPRYETAPNPSLKFLFSFVFVLYLLNCVRNCYFIFSITLHKRVTLRDKSRNPEHSTVWDLKGLDAPFGFLPVLCCDRPPSKIISRSIYHVHTRWHSSP